MYAAQEDGKNASAAYTAAVRRAAEGAVLPAHSGRSANAASSDAAHHSAAPPTRYGRCSACSSASHTGKNIALDKVR